MVEVRTPPEEFQQTVIRAIQLERSATPNTLSLRILECSDTNFGCKVRVSMQESEQEIEESELVIDEKFRGAQVSWAGKESNRSVVAQLSNDIDDVLLLGGIYAFELLSVTTLELECLDFLSPIVAAWKSREWSAKSLTQYTSMGTAVAVDQVSLAQQSISSRLSASQQGALDLVNHRVGYLWGPPGTGKTECCSVMLGAYLMAKADSKILVVGIANDPLDQVIQRTDALLKLYGRNDLRKYMTRYGVGALRCFYEHLLPGPNDALAPARPKESVASNLALKDPELSDFESNQKVTRLFALSIASAIARIEQLRAMAPFDLLLIEEASQANWAQVLPLMTLAKSTVVAGDPAQLSPVAKSEHADVRQWMGHSAFSAMPVLDSDCVHMLMEQRRMAEPICKLVSKVGYGEKLVTAPDCLIDGMWQSERKFTFAGFTAHQHVVVPKFQVQQGTMGAKYRLNSAAHILEMLIEQRATVTGLKPEDVLILSPFRRQVRLIRSILDKNGFREVRVKTVHKTQGKEAKIIIFDPVDGNCEFLKSQEAKRLLTVAFSRAKAKLLVLASDVDCANPILQLVKDYSH
jgi:DNA replication ATP-dependent helicase Dna2